MSARVSTHSARWFAAGMLVFVAGAVLVDKAALAQETGLSEEMKSFLESPRQQTTAAGAHKQKDPHASLSPDKLVQVALQHLDEGRAPLALETLNEALGKFPNDTMLLSVRSSLFLQNQQTSLALADLNRAVDLNPHDPILLTNRAQAYRQFGRNDDARRDLDSAIELDQKFVAAYFNRGSLHFEAEKYDLALVDFNRCVELEPEVPAAYFNRASTHEALGDRNSAVKDLQHFLTLSPEASWAQVAEDLLKQWQSENS